MQNPDAKRAAGTKWAVSVIVIASEAKQSRAAREALDCFGAMRLAMTTTFPCRVGLQRISR